MEIRDESQERMDAEFLQEIASVRRVHEISCKDAARWRRAVRVVVDQSRERDEAWIAAQLGDVPMRIVDTGYRLGDTPMTERPEQQAMIRGVTDPTVYADWFNGVVSRALGAP